MCITVARAIVFDKVMHFRYRKAPSTVESLFMTLKEICLPIRKQLEETETVIRSHLKSSIPFVTDVAEYVIINGGKRLRPILCLFSSRIAGATGDAVLYCAAAVEFFHSATLMHDDVIDNASLRRGKPSANARWGNQVTVLVGDFFYCHASDLLVKTNNIKAIDLITRAILSTTEGEILEITKSNDMNTSEEDYLKIITEKTAVLMTASCELGGILGNISEQYVRALGVYGNHLGVAFQLADDVLDYVADDEGFGKTNGTDLKEGKLTLPLIHTLRHCHDQERRLIKDALIAEDLEKTQLHEIIKIIHKYGGIEYTVDLSKTYIKKAKEALDLFKPSIDKEALLSLSDYVISRSI